MPENGRLDFVQLERRHVDSGLPPMDSLTGNMNAPPASLAVDLVQEFVHGLADALQARGLRHRQVRMGTVLNLPR